MARNVFVSYAARDGRARVQRVLDQLRERQVLRGDDLLVVDHGHVAAGEEWRRSTRAAIDAADAVVVLWSDAAAESKWVNYEMAMADALGKHLVVVAPPGQRGRVPLQADSLEVFELAM